MYLESSEPGKVQDQYQYIALKIEREEGRKHLVKLLTILEKKQNAIPHPHCQKS